ncbi:MAG TPA: hypothetical protein VLE03_06655 [Nitrospiraceae bacterium]|nr:hypothetical protein [Nitrospiraceae bacterium]
MMSHIRTSRALAVLLVLCILVVGGLASAQSITHESHHAHHQKATHSTVLCSWMCAAGQVLDSSAAPRLGAYSPVALVEQLPSQSIPHSVLDSSTSRGPPFYSI